MKAARARAVLVGGLVGGALDILFAISWAAYNGTPPLRLLQVVASGLLGQAAFDGGVATAATGLAAHFALSFLWAAALLAVALRRPALTARPVLAGVVFGTVVFFVMRLVVLPLSAFPFPVTFKPLGWGLDLLSHMFLFGTPIALAVRRAVPHDAAARAADRS
jgi:hypothetical protein